MKHYLRKIAGLKHFIGFHELQALLIFVFLGVFICFGICFAEETSKETNKEKLASEASSLEKVASETVSFTKLSEAEINKYVEDSASIINSDYKNSIAVYGTEIETQARIRVLVKTEIVKDLNEGQLKADAFFAEWIRTIGLDKKGILIYAMLPEGSAHGKILFKVGIGLKYLITKEMGEEILNQVILPNNAENRDGKGFMEGVLAIKRMLLDELARDKKLLRDPKSFDLDEFLWSYKELFFGLIIFLFIIYIVFFVERCPKCGGSLKVTKEVLKEPGDKTLGLQRKIYVCEKCGLTRRKKEPIYPSGLEGLKLRLSGTRRNIRVD